MSEHYREREFRNWAEQDDGRFQCWCALHLESQIRPLRQRGKNAQRAPDPVHNLLSIEAHNPDISESNVKVNLTNSESENPNHVSLSIAFLTNPLSNVP